MTKIVHYESTTQLPASGDNPCTYNFNGCCE